MSRHRASAIDAAGRRSQAATSAPRSAPVWRSAARPAGPASLLMAALCVAGGMCLAARGAEAQVGADGELVAIPFAAPWPVARSSEADGQLVRVYDVAYEPCVAWFQAQVSSDAPLTEGWRVGGRAWETARGRWVFTLTRQDRTHFAFAVEPDTAGCRLVLETASSPMPGGRWRYAYPPLRLSNGDAIDVDPYVREQ